MNYFLQDVARYLFENSGGDLREKIVVFPNRRARLFFNHFLSQLSEKPIWSPKYYTISDFVEKLSGLRIADSLSLLFKLFKVFRKVTGSNESFDSFYFYCEMILADFDDIDKYHVDAGQLYRNLNDLKTLEDYYEYLEEKQIKTLREFWEIFNASKDSSEKQQFISIWDALFKIYLGFNSALDEEGLAYEGKAYRSLISKLNEGTENSDFKEQISFVGFNALNYSEELLFEHFKKRGNAQFFWDFNADYVNSDYHEAGYFLRKYLNKFPSPENFSSADCAHDEQNIYTVSAPATISQAKITEYSLGLVGSDKISGPLQTALILADEGLLIPVVNSLPSELDKINISLGYPITDTPAYNFINQLANLQKSKRISTSDQTSFYSKDLFNLYQHEFLRSIIGDAEYFQFENYFTERNQIYISLDQITLDDPASKLILQSITDSNSFVSWLRQIIEEVAKQFHNNENISKQILWQMEVLLSMHKVLQRFEALLKESDIVLTLPTTMSLIYKMLAGLSVPFSGEPLDGLQVMGILETRTLDFKNIIILSMNEGSFPKTGHAPSFIPFALRDGFGLPTIRHQDAIYSYYFYRLLHKAKNVVLVYNTKTEGLQKGEPSRYIQQLRFDSSRAVKHINLVYRIDSSPSPGIIANKDDFTSRQLNKYIDKNEKYYLSPSAINAYLSCKLKFYFRYIEKLGEPDTISESIEANVFGSILHKTMKLLYTDFEDKKVSGKDFEKLSSNDDFIHTAINQAFNEEYFNLPSNAAIEFKGRNIIVRQVIKTYVKGILDYDTKNSPSRIGSLEKRFVYPVKIDETGKEIRLGGLIDRIDYMGDLVRIVDYKTGRKEMSYKGIKELFSSESGPGSDSILQSMFYSWMIHHLEGFKNIQPSLFFVRDIIKEAYDPCLVNKSDGNSRITDFKVCLPEFEQELMHVLSDIFDQKTPFTQTEDEKNCNYCTYTAICRRASE